MSDRKFSFMLEFVYKDIDGYNYPKVRDIFGSYVEDSYVDNRFYLLAQKASAKIHLSNLSKWKKVFDRLARDGWNGDGYFMWIYILGDGDLDKKLRIFFDNNKKEMEDVANTTHLYGIISDYFHEIQIELGGLDIHDVRSALYQFKKRILLIDAILDYCDSRSL